MLNNSNNRATKDSLPAWNKYLLTTQKKNSNFEFASSILMGHYLMVFESGFYDSLTYIFVIDMRYKTVQEIKVDERLLNLDSDTLLKYNENQILIFREGQSGKAIWKILTIQSFQPFQWSSRNVKTQSMPRSTAQIFKGSFYAYGQVGSGSKSQLWNFDFINQTAIACQTTGEDPGTRTYPSSCIIEESLYIYEQGHDPAQEMNIFKLEFNTMTWTRFDQKVNYFGEKRTRLKGAVLKNQLIFLGNDSVLYCWDATQNTWSTFNIEKSSDYLWAANLIVYKDLLVRIEKQGTGVYMCSLNLQNFGLGLSANPAEQLFMSEESSDIVFKIGDKTLPAHKSILMEKSRYFANLFNSGMSESRQKVIEVDDCEYDVFQAFLRFLYLDEVDLNNTSLAIKLSTLADKYLQNDLNEICQNILKGKVNSENVYTVLDFACLEEIEDLRKFCIEFLKLNLNTENLAELILYLDKEPHQEHIEITNYVFDYVQKNYAPIHLSDRRKNTTALRGAVFNWTKKQLKEGKCATKKYSSEIFWLNFASFSIENQIDSAHKQILIARSRYFRNLFNRDLEPRQKVPQIDDHELALFREFLRFLSCEEINIEDVDGHFAIKLREFPYQFIQDYLRDEWIEDFESKIKSQNIYTLLKFTLQEGISQLKVICVEFVHQNISVKNLPQLISYLDQSDLSQIENIKLQSLAIKLTLRRYLSSQIQGNLSFYETFLVKYMSMENFSIILDFVYRKDPDEMYNLDESDEINLTHPLREREDPDFQKTTANLKNAALDFALAHVDEFRQLSSKRLRNSLPLDFLLEVISKSATSMNKLENENRVLKQENELLKSLESGKKDGLPEDEAVLQKLKQTSIQEEEEE